MVETVRISIACPDQPGLVAAITGRLFDLGVNLGDATFAVLGAGATFSAVCELPVGVAGAELERELAVLPELEGAELQVVPYTLGERREETANITHHVVLRGGDTPGLIARLAEVFGEYGANIVRLDSEKIPGEDGDQYVIRLAVWLPVQRAEA